MQLIIRRDKDNSIMGVNFLARAKVVLTPEEEELINKYKCHRETCYSKERVSYRIKDLITGVKKKAINVNEILEHEKEFKEAAEKLQTILRVLNTLGQDQIVDLK